MSASEFDRPATQWPDSGSEVPLQPVARLIYASMSLVDGPVFDEMRRIRDHAVAHNQKQGIRVALLHMNGWFVEWIEGPESAIQDLINRVAQDARHHGLRVIHRSFGKPRLFKPWIGSIVQSTERRDAFGLRVFELQDRFDRGESMEPASVWLNLCSPPNTDMRVPIGGYPRVMLLPARGTKVFDLLQWLARNSQHNLVRRRFAGAAADAPDVESDYLDLPGQGLAGLRLIANARKGLAMGMTHAFLPDYAAVGLLLDDDATRNRRIIDRVLSACRQVHHVPVIVGLGTPEQLTPELLEQVERQGLAWRPAATRVAQPDMPDYWAALHPVLAKLE